MIVNADSGIVNTPFDDLSSLPIEVKETLQKGLKSKNLLGDVVARTHLSALVHLIGGYRDALKLRQGEKITFDENSFINSRPGHMAPFLRQMLELQLFRQFVEERLTLLNSGKSVSDEFEREVLRYAERSPHSAKLRSQAAQLKREGKKIAFSFLFAEIPSRKFMFFYAPRNQCLRSENEFHRFLFSKQMNLPKKTVKFSSKEMNLPEEMNLPVFSGKFIS